MQVLGMPLTARRVGRQWSAMWTSNSISSSRTSPDSTARTSRTTGSIAASTSCLPTAMGEYGREDDGDPEVGEVFVANIRMSDS